MVQKKFIKVSTEQLIPYENNPRINDPAVADVVESIKQCENLDPIEIDEDFVILSGHTRLLAMQQLGITETEVVQYTGLTDEQKRKYRILANKTNELAEWDFDKLEQELADLDFSDFSFDFEDETEMQNEGGQKQTKPEVEFTEVLLEEHNYVVLYFTNSVDWLQLCSLLNIQPKKNLSTRTDGKINKGMERVSTGRVVNGAKALEVLRNEFSNQYQLSEL